VLSLPPVKRTLYAERIEVTAEPAAFARAQSEGLSRAELDYVKALVEAGKLLLGGDLDDPREGGLYILRAASHAEAVELVRGRPFARAGLVRSIVHEWHVRYEVLP
jgi:hypothetical protein